jgi:hypothetical protein
MKTILLVILFVFFTAISIIVPYKVVSSANTPKLIEVGPNQTYFWTSGYTLSRSFEGTFSLKSSSYFELRQEGKKPKQSVFEGPPVGENQGMYWIRDYPMSGTWINSNHAEIFSLEPSTFISTPYFIKKGFNIFIVAVFGFFFWLISVSFVTWLDVRL